MSRRLDGGSESGGAGLAGAGAGFSRRLDGGSESGGAGLAGGGAGF